MKKLYGDAFQRAFRQALDDLDAEDRLLLKQRFRHHMGVVELGVLLGVHASTITRRVAAARDRLVTATQAEMMRDLGVEHDEMSSILRTIASVVDITLTSHEAGAPER